MIWERDIYGPPQKAEGKKLHTFQLQKMDEIQFEITS